MLTQLPAELVRHVAKQLQHYRHLVMLASTCRRLRALLSPSFMAEYWRHHAHSLRATATIQTQINQSDEFFYGIWRPRASLTLCTAYTGWLPLVVHLRQDEADVYAPMLFSDTRLFLALHDTLDGDRLQSFLKALERREGGLETIVPASIPTMTGLRSIRVSRWVDKNYAVFFRTWQDTHRFVFESGQVLTIIVRQEREVDRLEAMMTWWRRLDFLDASATSVQFSDVVVERYGVRLSDAERRAIAGLQDRLQNS
jgi:hypothetical protein